VVATGPASAVLNGSLKRNASRNTTSSASSTLGAG
jgi:hypothetical protein